MLKCKDIILYIKALFKMNSVYDCARPFLFVSGIFGIGGNKICEIEGVRSVRNTTFSLFIAALLNLVFMPMYFYIVVTHLFSGKIRAVLDNTIFIILYGVYGCILFTISVGCIQTHVHCKNLTKVFQILNNTDMMLQQENIKVNYWKIILNTILCGLVSLPFLDILIIIVALSPSLPFYVVVTYIVKIFIELACNQFFMWVILFLQIIRENFVGLNKLLLQNAQVSNMQDNSLLRRVSLARDIHEQLSEAIVLFSNISRIVIIGFLVPSVLNILLYTVCIMKTWIDSSRLNLRAFLINLHPMIGIMILTVICESHKNNRRMLTARLRHLIAFAEDRRIIQQLKPYILFNHTTVAGLVDFQLIDIDFTLLFMIIDIIANYTLVIYSTFR